MKWLAQRWFLLALALVLSLGMAGAAPLQPLTRLQGLQQGITAAVLFLMALPLEATAFTRSVTHPAPAVLACLVNMGFVPLAAWAVSFLLTDAMGMGLRIAAVVPCTLASAAVWTRRAGGNDAAALLVTLITNATCFVVTPLWVLAMTGRAVENSALGFAAMSRQLALLVVLPMAVAQLLRAMPWVARIADRCQAPLAVLAQCGILTMVFFGAIRSGWSVRLERGTSAGLGDCPTMLAAVLAVHLAALYVGMYAARWSRLSRGDQIAVGLAGSQKTLMVGLVVANALQVTILPMVGYQVLQLFVDTLIADRFRARGAPGRAEAHVGEIRR